ncbi:MAG TPA: hypothetical protein VLS25_06625, partial [Dehalococcoidia bacterium]|nr:hypothetical protein [Dehalococcoidia bacterium]
VRALLPVLALAALLTSVSPSASSAETTKDPRLDSHLARLVPASAGDTPVTLPQEIGSLRDAGFIRFDPAGRVLVFVYPSGSIKDAAGLVTATGGEVERVSPGSGAIQAAIPVSRLADVAHDAAVRYIGLPAYPALNAGSRITEGDSLLNVDTLRAAYHVNGAGVRVGVISDGIAGFQKSQQSADLPSEIDYQTCNVTPDVDPTSPIAGGEGTAMLEIVHDLAPGAELWFANFGFGSSTHGTVLDFMTAVDCLASHVDVIVDDVSWFGTGPYDGTSAVSLNTSDQLNDSTNPVRLYATSVGNWAQHHYHDPYEPCDGEDVQTFQATARTVDAHGSGPLCYNPITVGPFSIALLSLQWNDPFGASCNDYDLQFRDHSTGEVLASSTNPQTCTQDPVEEVAWTNSTVDTVTVDVVVQNPGGLAAPRDFDIFAIALDLGYWTPAGSIPNQSDAGGGVLSVGAIGAFDQGLDSAEPWSSNGPTADGRTKPDLTAVDCVKVTGNSFSSP